MVCTKTLTAVLLASKRDLVDKPSHIVPEALLMSNGIWVGYRRGCFSYAHVTRRLVIVYRKSGWLPMISVSLQQKIKKEKLQKTNGMDAHSVGDR